jgi:hypothetical protein
MHFIVFMLLVYTLALFHRFEHRAMVADLSRLAADLPLRCGVPRGHDWRQTGGTEEAPQLKRGFELPDRTAVLRYALPVVFAAAMMIVLQDFTLAGGYVALCAAKWFGLSVTLTRGAYAVSAGGITLLKDSLPQA